MYGKEELADSPAFVKAEVPEALDPEQFMYSPSAAAWVMYQKFEPNCNAPVPPGTGLEAAGVGFKRCSC